MGKIHKSFVALNNNYIYKPILQMENIQEWIKRTKFENDSGIISAFSLMMQLDKKKSSVTPIAKIAEETVNKEDVVIKETKEEEKPTTCVVRSFFRNYLSYFFFTVSAMTFSSYIVYRRMSKN